MKRGVVDTIRRAFDNTVANWPLIAIRVAEWLISVGVVIGGVIVIVVPILVSLGLSLGRLRTPGGVAEMAETLITRWSVVAYALAIVLGIVLVLVVLHSFVQAGCARVLADAERVAGAEVNGPRSRFRVFSMDRWLAGATRGWWTIFWIYNLAWGATCLVLLVPLLPTVILMLVLRENAAAVALIGCGGVAIVLMLFVLVAIATTIWTTRATASWATGHLAARDALAHAWAEIKRDFARHALIALALFVVAMAGSSFLASFSMFATLGETIGRHSGSVTFFTFPLRMLASFANSIFSSAIGLWFLAAYAGLGVEEK